MIVDINDILFIYEKEVSVNTKNKKKVLDFEKYKIENVYEIKRIIESGSYIISKYNIFFISSPKYRIVMSLNIRDKVINHYVTRYILIPKLDRYLDIRNCATRSGMGYSYALSLVNKYIEIMKKYDRFYILRIDISKFFYSIDHGILKDLIRDKFSLDEFNLISSIIDSTDSVYVNDSIRSIKRYLSDRDVNREKEIDKLPLYDYGKGLPIGNMTSQFLSIFYLYKLDHFIVNVLHLKYMVRYMDDYIIFFNDKDVLRRALIVISDILNSDYKLSINGNKTKILDSYHGFEFLGYMFYIRNNKTIVKKKSSNKKRMVRGIRNSSFLYGNGYISFKSYYYSINSYLNRGL